MAGSTTPTTSRPVLGWNPATARALLNDIRLSTLVTKEASVWVGIYSKSFGLLGKRGRCRGWLATRTAGLRRGGSPLGLHRVIEPAGVLPQAAWRLDPDPGIWPDEVRVRVERLNLDAASFRQLRESTGGTAAAMRAAVLGIVADRGKMQNPVTGSGGMLTGVVAEAGPESPLGLAPGDRVASLVSLSLTPLAITDGLAGWDGQGEQVPCAGHAILFGRSIAAVLPGDLPAALALAVLDVCGAPALTERVVRGPRGQQGRRWWPSSAPAGRAGRCPPRRPGGPVPAP